MEEVVVENNRGDNPAKLFNEIMIYLNGEIASKEPVTSLEAFDAEIGKLNNDNVKSYLAQNMQKFEQLKMALEQFREKVSNSQNSMSDTANVQLMTKTMSSIASLEQELKQHPDYIMVSVYQKLHELSQAKQKVHYWEARQDTRPLKAPQRIEHYKAEVDRLETSLNSNLPRYMRKQLLSDKKVMDRMSALQSQITEIQKKIATWTKRQNIMPNKASEKLSVLNSTLNEQKSALEETLKLISPQGLQQNINILEKQIQQAELKLTEWSDSRRPIKARQKIAFYTRQLENLKAKKEGFLNALPKNEDLKSSVEVAVVINPQLEALKAIHDIGASDNFEDKGEPFMFDGNPYGDVVIGVPESELKSETEEETSREEISPENAPQSESAQSSQPIQIQLESVIDRSLNAIATLLKDLPRKNKDFSGVQNMSAVVNNFSLVLQKEMDNLTQQAMQNPQNAAQVNAAMIELRGNVINWMSEISKVEKFRNQSTTDAQRLNVSLNALMDKINTAIEDVQIFSPEFEQEMPESEASEISQDEQKENDKIIYDGVEYDDVPLVVESESQEVEQEEVKEFSNERVNNDPAPLGQVSPNSRINEILHNISNIMQDLPRVKKDFSGVENISAVVNNFALVLQKEMDDLTQQAMQNPQNAAQVNTVMIEIRVNVINWVCEISKVEKFRNQSTSGAQRLNVSLNALMDRVNTAIEDVQIFNQDNKADVSQSKSNDHILMNVPSAFRVVALEQLSEKASVKPSQEVEQPEASAEDKKDQSVRPNGS